MVTVQGAVTLQEERARLSALQVRALELTTHLRDHPSVALQRQHSLLRELEQLVTQGEANTAHGMLFMARGDALALPQDQEFSALKDELLDVLQDMRMLSLDYPMPGPLGNETPGGFLDGVCQRPQELRDLLLRKRPDGELLEEGFLTTLRCLETNLNTWRDTPALEDIPEHQERRGTHKKLLKFCRDILGGLYRVGDDDLRASYLKLLRWRLERCEDPLALPEVWTMPHWYFDAQILECALELVRLLRQALLENEGETPLSLGSWDALMGATFELMRRVDDCLEDGPGLRSPATMVRNLQRLEGRLPALRRSLTALEREGLAELPEAMQRVFLEGALLELMPQVRRMIEVP